MAEVYFFQRNRTCFLTTKAENIDGKTETSYYFGDYLIGSASVAQATPSPTPEPTTEAEDSTEADSTGTDISTEDESGQTEAENTTEKKACLPCVKSFL